MVGESLSEEAEKSQDEQTNQGNLLSPVKKIPDSPEKKKRKTKAELKEELTKQKVMEKKAALRRQRTRNKRWARDIFFVIGASDIQEKKCAYFFIFIAQICSV